MADLLDRLSETGRTDRRLGLWVTEYGYQTDPPDPTQRVTPALQARWLPEAERQALGDRRVRSFSQFLLRDLPSAPARPPKRGGGTSSPASSSPTVAPSRLGARSPTPSRCAG